MVSSRTSVAHRAVTRIGLVPLALWACACDRGTHPPAGAAAPSATAADAATDAATSGGAAPATASAAAPPAALHDGIDAAVAPGDDFFAYGNGGWLKRTVIPADRASYGVGDGLVELTARRVADLIAENARSHPAAGSDAAKVGDYYASFMDEAAIEAKGVQPLRPAFAAIAAIADARGLGRALGAQLRADVDVLNATRFDTTNLFGLWVAQDLSDPRRYSAFLLQGGLGLPDRDYYLDSKKDMADIREKYQRHIAAVLQLAKIEGAEVRAHAIFGLEQRIARAHVPRMETKDVAKGNNHWKRREFARRAPGLDWDAFFAAAGLDHEETLVVWQPAAVTGLAALVRSQPLGLWKDYLTFRAIERVAAFLPRAFVEEDFAFYGRVLNGTPSLRERWKRAVDVTNFALGEVVGKLYVERYFPASEKARAEELVRNEIRAFAARLDRLEWMAPSTRAAAKAKLAVLKVGVGYPDKWRDYSKLEVIRGDALGNAARAELFRYHWNLAKLGNPIDRGEWVMDPQVVNAVNLPAMNALNFPAAILQPPLFDPRRPLATDYGSTGATIGHEIAHSFDDQGALFDAEGRLRNWWTAADHARFLAASAKMVAQYDHYRPFPDLPVNGKLTLGENIADVAGLSVAYDAYRLATHGQAPVAEGLSGDQQFFLSYAQSWRTKMREALSRQLLVTDGHAPDEYRADTVRNLDAWYDAFTVTPAHKLYLAPAERVRVW